MKRQSSSSSFSVSQSSSVNSPLSNQQITESGSVSGHIAHSSSAGRVAQNYASGSSHNLINPRELNFMNVRSSPEPHIGTNNRLDNRITEPDGDSLSLSVLATLRVPESRTAREDVVPQNLDLNIAYEDTDGSADQETGTDSVNQTSNLGAELEAYMREESWDDIRTITDSDLETLMRNTRQRISLEHEGRHVSSVHLDSSSQMVQPSYWNSANSSGSNSSTPFSFLPASGSDSLQQVSLQYHPGSSSAQSVPVPGIERGNLHEVPITSSAFPQHHRSQAATTVNPTSFPANYSSQNGVAAVHPSVPPAILQQHVPSGSQSGFSGDVHAPATPPMLPQRNIADEYEERVSGIVGRSMLRVPAVGSEGQLVDLQPLRAFDTHRGPDSRLSHRRARQPRPRPRVQRRAAGHSSNVRRTQTTMDAEDRARMVRLLESIHRVNTNMLNMWEQLWWSDDEDEDLHPDVDNMTYEELLALEERIGDVSTGLGIEAISEGIRKHKYRSMQLGLPVEEEPCCICQEDYNDGEELGTLNCGHAFHFNCIKEWLIQKNVCPICKTTAVAV